MFSILRIAGISLIVFYGTLTVWLANDIVQNFQICVGLQSWITAAGVVVAASLAVWQQRRIDTREHLQRQRKDIAARAVMPTALAEICEYIEKCVTILKKLYPRNGDSSLLGAPLKFPDLPISATIVLRDCVEYANDDDARIISRCLGKLQIYKSRGTRFMSNLEREPINNHQFDMILSYSIEVHSDFSSLYSYARSEQKKSEKIDPRELVFSTLISLSIDEENFPSLFEILRNCDLIW